MKHVTQNCAVLQRSSVQFGDEDATTGPGDVAAHARHPAWEALVAACPAQPGLFKDRIYGPFEATTGRRQPSAVETQISR